VRGRLEEDEAAKALLDMDRPLRPLDDEARRALSLKLKLP
jgi:hypothetical protein